MKNKINDSDIMRSAKKYHNPNLPKESVGISDVPKSTQTRLDLKLMQKRKGMGYEQMEKTMVGKLEANLRGAMKMQKSTLPSNQDVPRRKESKHHY